MNSGEVREMIRTAQNEQVFLMEAFFTPHQPSYQEARKILGSGELGEIKHLHGWFGFNKSPYDSNGRLYNPALGGGVMLDIGLYPLFDALFFLGNPISTNVSADLTDNGIDQTISVSMQFEGAKSATFFASFLSAIGVGTDIYCEKGMMRLRRTSALNQWLEIVVPGKPIRTINWDESLCGMKLEALDVMNCLDNLRVESEVMGHQNSLDLIRMLDLIGEKARKKG